MQTRRGLALLAIVLAVSACGFLERRSGPYPEACEALASPQRQCDAIVAWARDAAHVDPADVAAIRFIPFESEATLGGYQIARVEFQLQDGARTESDVWCTGVGSSFMPTCNPEAEIMGGGGGIDRDVPCGPPPAGCATVPPTPAPEAFEHGRPLEIQNLDIPIVRKGQYEVEIGRAVLPNGYLSERSLAIVDRRPTAFWTDHVALHVRSDIRDRPPVGSIYREPFDGPEPVTVYIVFDVKMFEEPSTLQLRDIVVR